MEENKKKFIINMRRDGGVLRLIISILFIVVALAFLYVGYQLSVAGFSGEWGIVSNFKGWTLYLTSLSPGLFVIFLGAVILIYALPKVIKSL